MTKVKNKNQTQRRLEKRLRILMFMFALVLILALLGVLLSVYIYPEIGLMLYVNIFECGGRASCSL